MPRFFNVLMIAMHKSFHLLLVISLLSGVSVAAVYQQADDFIKESFSSSTPELKVFWPDAELKQAMEKILGHPYQGLRIRYWINGQRSAWILDEIGKDKPITTGVVINQNKIEKIRVLEFRESRGWEVQHRFFTQQFDQASLTTDQQLDRNIDNISGATLSVKALTKVARLALLLHQHVMPRDQP